jgi:hypothetical protein
MTYFRPDPVHVTYDDNHDNLHGSIRYTEDFRHYANLSRCPVTNVASKP